MVAEIIFGLLGLGGACLLLFHLMVHALPTFVGVSAGLLAFNTGAGAIGATTVGLLGGVATLALGQLHFTLARSVLARTLVAFLFAVPAAYAGYCATLSLAWYGVPSDTWRHIIAVTGAGAIAAIAVSQLAGSVATAGHAN